ncbi:hypothetical protein HDU67_009648, partial [Dinochytrium kinnereticum]
SSLTNPPPSQNPTVIPPPLILGPHILNLAPHLKNPLSQPPTTATTPPPPTHRFPHQDRTPTPRGEVFGALGVGGGEEGEEEGGDRKGRVEGEEGDGGRDRKGGVEGEEGGDEDQKGVVEEEQGGGGDQRGAEEEQGERPMEEGGDDDINGLVEEQVGEEDRKDGVKENQREASRKDKDARPLLHRKDASKDNEEEDGHVNKPSSPNLTSTSTGRRITTTKTMVEKSGGRVQGFIGAEVALPSEEERERQSFTFRTQWCQWTFGFVRGHGFLRGLIEGVLRVRVWVARGALVLGVGRVGKRIQGVMFRTGPGIFTIAVQAYLSPHSSPPTSTSSSISSPLFHQLHTLFDYHRDGEEGRKGWTSEEVVERGGMVVGGVQFFPAWAFGHRVGTDQMPVEVGRVFVRHLFAGSWKV